MDNRLNATYEGKGCIIGTGILLALAVLGTVADIVYKCF